MFDDRLSQLDIEKRPCKSLHQEQHFFNEVQHRKRQQSSDMHEPMPAAKEQKCNQSAVYIPVSPACQQNKEHVDTALQPRCQEVKQLK